MPHISQQDLDEKTKRQIIETLDMVLGSMNKNEIHTFLSSFLSETERLMFSKRLAIALLIKEGVDHSSITQNIAVTRETVGRIELSILKKPAGFIVAIEKMNKDKAMQSMKNMLVKFASYSIKAAGGRV